VINPDLSAATSRIYRSMAAIAAAGTVVGLVYGGFPVGGGFLVGAIFSILNFWFWHLLVRRIGETGGTEEGPRKASTTLFALRYLIFGLVLYGILLYFKASLFAALVGCFVAVAAVILEILVELIYGTS
jgi:hypothetical protein